VKYRALLLHPPPAKNQHRQSQENQGYFYATGGIETADHIFETRALHRFHALYALSLFCCVRCKVLYPTLKRHSDDQSTSRFHFTE
jgi:hypothetical protein